MRRAASLAIDRRGTNEALTLGYSLISGNPIVPDSYEFFRQPPAPAYDPEKARQLLAEAGYPRGFDAGNYYCDSSDANVGEAVLDYLRAVGLRARSSAQTYADSWSTVTTRPARGRLNGGGAWVRLVTAAQNPRAASAKLG